MAELSDAVRTFLLAARMARVATVNADGAPHVVPMWYLLDGGVFYFTTLRARLTARNIRRDARVSIVVDDDDVEHYRGVSIEGVADLTPERTVEVAHGIARRYLGERDGDRYARFMLGQRSRTAMRVRPARISHWGIDRPDAVARLRAGDL